MGVTYIELLFGSKKTSKISVVLEDLSGISAFFRTEVKPLTYIWYIDLSSDWNFEDITSYTPGFSHFIPLPEAMRQHQGAHDDEAASGIPKSVQQPVPVPSGERGVLEYSYCNILCTHIYSICRVDLVFFLFVCFINYYPFLPPPPPFSHIQPKLPPG